MKGWRDKKGKMGGCSVTCVLFLLSCSNSHFDSFYFFFGKFVCSRFCFQPNAHILTGTSLIVNFLNSCFSSFLFYFDLLREEVIYLHLFK